MAVLVGALAAHLAPRGTPRSGVDSPSSATAPPTETALERRSRLLGSTLEADVPLTAPARLPKITRGLIPQYRDKGRARVFRPRPTGWEPVAIVLHTTGSGAPGSSLDSLARVQWFFSREAARASAHYAVDRRGRIMQLVADDQAAFHVATPGWNDISIGIELINDSSGRDPFTRRQLQSTRRLVRHLGARYDIPAGAVVRHRDVQPEDRTDPPGNFPWRTWRGSLAD